jgi:PAS domain S-box-containing protein
MNDRENTILRLEERALLLGVEAVEDYAIFLLDPEGRVATWNRGAERIKGYTAHEILGQHFSRFYPLEAVAAHHPEEELAIARREGRYEEEGWRVRRNGERFWASVVITAIYAHDFGVLRGFTIVTRDLTERRRADERLRSSEERLRLLIESVKDYAIFMLDPQGVVTTWNAGAERIKGYRADEIIGKHFSVFYPLEAVAARHPEKVLQEAARNGRYEAEGWRIRKDGSRFWANIVLTAMLDPQTGSLRGFAKVTRDLTERRRIEEEARLAATQAASERVRAEDARKAVEQRDEFISIAAHELKTPITALALRLDGLGEALRQMEGRGDRVPPMLAARLATAVGQLDRLTRLVQRLLDVTRIVKGELPLELGRSDLSEIVQAVVTDFREAAQQRGSELRFRSSGPVVGLWDAGRIAQGGLNVLSNANRYGMRKPIDIAVEENEKDARLVVTDRGIGIAAEDTQRIFRRFERIPSAINEAGLGLGLYISRNIVEAHGGEITVSSREGEGSTFVVTLPKGLSGSAEGAAGSSA